MGTLRKAVGRVLVTLAVVVGVVEVMPGGPSAIAVEAPPNLPPIVACSDGWDRWPYHTWHEFFPGCQPPTQNATATGGPLIIRPGETADVAFTLTGFPVIEPPIQFTEPTNKGNCIPNGSAFCVSYNVHWSVSAFLGTPPLRPAEGCGRDGANEISHTTCRISVDQNVGPQGDAGERWRFVTAELQHGSLPYGYKAAFPVYIPPELYGVRTNPGSASVLSYAIRPGSDPTTEDCVAYNNDGRSTSADGSTGSWFADRVLPDCVYVHEFGAFVPRGDWDVLTFGQEPVGSIRGTSTTWEPVRISVDRNDQVVALRNVIRPSLQVFLAYDGSDELAAGEQATLTAHVAAVGGNSGSLHLELGALQLDPARLAVVDGPSPAPDPAGFDLVPGQSVAFEYTVQGVRGPFAVVQLDVTGATDLGSPVTGSGFAFVDVVGGAEMEARVELLTEAGDPATSPAAGDDLIARVYVDNIGDVDIDGIVVHPSSFTDPPGGVTLGTAVPAATVVPVGHELAVADIPFTVGTDLTQYAGATIVGTEPNGDEVRTSAIESFDVPSSNLPPVAVDDAYAVERVTILQVPAPGVLANDSDPEGDSFFPFIASPPTAGGFASVDFDGSLLYFGPDADVVDTFTYQLYDGISLSPPATVRVRVGNPPAGPPVANGDSYTVGEDGSLVVDAAGVLANDTSDDGSALTAALVDDVEHGTLALATDGSFSYTPAPNYAGPDSFTYRASDGAASSAETSVAIGVVAVPDPPVATDDTYVTHEDQLLTVPVDGVLGNDHDADGDALTVAVVDGVDHGVLTLDPNGSFAYTPAADHHGSDSFTYRANDGGADSAVATVTLEITAVNDAPTAAGEAHETAYGTDLVVVAPGVLGNDADVDGPTLAAVGVTQPAHGTLALNADGSFTYTPASGYWGPDAFTYQASDGSLASSPVTVAITVAPPPPELRIDDVVVTEGNAGTTAATFTVSLARTADAPVTVQFETMAGSASAGSDFVAASGTVTIPTGSSSAPLEVSVNGDLIDEPNEGFTVVLSAPSPAGATIADDTGAATITDDDPPVAAVTASVGNASVSEGNGGTREMTFTVRLSAPSTAAQWFTYATVEGTATDPEDFVAETGTVAFAPGQVTRTFTVTVRGDGIDEGASERFSVTLAALTGAGISDGSGEGTIVDDDPLPRIILGSGFVVEGHSGTRNLLIPVALDRPSSSTVTVRFSTVNGTATAGSDYTARSNQTLTFAPGEQVRTVAVAVRGDRIREWPEAFELRLSQPKQATLPVQLGLGLILDDD